MTAEGGSPRNGSANNDSPPTILLPRELQIEILGFALDDFCSQNDYVEGLWYLHGEQYT